MPALATALKMPGVSALPRNFNKTARPIFTTEMVLPDELGKWDHPSFQRPLLINSDVIALAIAMQLEAAEESDNMCNIPGTVEFGRYGGKDHLIDGQHRIHGAFAIASGVKRVEDRGAILVPGGVLAKAAAMDIKITPYDTFAEMAEAFAAFNKKLVALKPDDLLRAREESNPHLKRLRMTCPFIGYTKNKDTKDHIMLSMSTAIRTWFGSGYTPASGPAAENAQRQLAADETEADNLIEFFEACEQAGWVGNYPRLWGACNLGINMWLWRKMVLGTANKFRGGPSTSWMILTKAQYTEGMVEMRKSAEYQSFLSGLSLRYQDRMPTYEWLKSLFKVVIQRHGLIGAKFPVPQGWNEDK